MKNFFFLGIFFLFLFGCGYRSGLGDVSSKTLSIPYVKGDPSGYLTGELVRAFSSCGHFSYCHTGGEFELLVEVLGSSQEQIGYKRDRHEETNHVKKNIIATEGRNTVDVEARLVERSSSKIIWGPRKISVDVDYDYVAQDSLKDLSFINSCGKRVPVLSFSLGQLETPGSATEASEKPLYRKLSQKIIDAIFAEW